MQFLVKNIFLFICLFPLLAYSQGQESESTQGDLIIQKLSNRNPKKKKNVKMVDPYALKKVDISNSEVRKKVRLAYLRSGTKIEDLKNNSFTFVPRNLYVYLYSPSNEKSLTFILDKEKRIRYLVDPTLVENLQQVIDARVLPDQYQVYNKEIVEVIKNDNLVFNQTFKLHGESFDNDYLVDFFSDEEPPSGWGFRLEYIAYFNWSPIFQFGGGFSYGQGYASFNDEGTKKITNFKLGPTIRLRVKDFESSILNAYLQALTAPSHKISDKNTSEVLRYTSNSLVVGFESILPSEKNEIILGLSFTKSWYSFSRVEGSARQASINPQEKSNTTLALSFGMAFDLIL